MGRNSKDEQAEPEIERKSAKRPQDPNKKSRDNNKQRKRKIAKETWVKIVAIGIVLLFVFTAFGVAIGSAFK